MIQNKYSKNFEMVKEKIKKNLPYPDLSFSEQIVSQITSRNKEIVLFKWIAL